MPSEKSEIILRDAFNGWADGTGIFAILALNGTLPWAESGIDSTTLDLAYFGNHSGGKFCAPLARRFVDEETGEISAAHRAALAKIILAKHIVNWNHLWATYDVDYNPVESYDVTISRDLVKADNREDDMSGTIAKTGTDTVAYGKVDSGINSTYGFNSTEAVPTNESSVTASGSDVNTKNLLDTQDESGASVNSGEESETISKHGNNGVYTKQRLISEDRSLWIWDFFESVFKDLDTELALKYFDPCRV